MPSGSNRRLISRIRGKLSGGVPQQSSSSAGCLRTINDPPASSSSRRNSGKPSAAVSGKPAIIIPVACVTDSPPNPRTRSANRATSAGSIVPLHTISPAISAAGHSIPHRRFPANRRPSLCAISSSAAACVCSTSASDASWISSSNPSAPPRSWIATVLSCAWSTLSISLPSRIGTRRRDAKTLCGMRHGVQAEINRSNHTRACRSPRSSACASHSRQHFSPPYRRCGRWSRQPAQSSSR